MILTDENFETALISELQERKRQIVATISKMNADEDTNYCKYSPEVWKHYNMMLLRTQQRIQAFALLRDVFKATYKC